MATPPCGHEPPEQRVKSVPLLVRVVVRVEPEMRDTSVVLAGSPGAPVTELATQAWMGSGVAMVARVMPLPSTGPS
jgi:hypothetical protein